MNVKSLFENYSLKKAALLLAEQRLQLRESPGDDMLFEQVIGMTQMAYEIFDGYSLKALYDYYCHQLDQPLPKPGETVLYYDPIDGHQPKTAKVVEYNDWPKLVKIECNSRTIEICDRYVHLYLYW